MSDIPTLLSRHLKARRKATGLTLSQVSEQAGMSVSFLSDIETRRASPSLETLYKLAACYSTSVASLFIEAEAEEYAKQVRICLLEKMLRDIEDELARLREGANATSL